MLERTGEERSRRRRSFQLLTVVAEADDDRTGIDLTERVQQDVDALVVDELAEEDDRRLVAGEELREALRIPAVGMTLVRVPRVRRIGPRLGEQFLQRLLARRGAKLVDVHARRHLVDAFDLTDDVLEHLADMGRSDVDGFRSREASPSAQVVRSSLPRIEYSSSEPCALTTNGTPLATPTGAPSSTWFANTRSAGMCAHNAVAFRAT